MPMPSGAPGAAYMSQTLGDPSLTAARATEVADLVAGLSDLSQRVQDLSSLLADAERQTRALSDRAREGSSKRSKAARALEQQGWEDALSQNSAQVRRLREALHDVQKDIDTLSAQHGTSSELNEMRVRCQNEDIRARQAANDINEMRGQEILREEDAQAQRRKQEQRQRSGEANSGSHLQSDSGASGAPKASNGWQPPEEARSAFEDVAQRASQYIRRESKNLSSETLSANDGPGSSATSSAQADIQARFANAASHPSMPKFHDPADLVQWVIRQAHADGSLDIQGYAHKLYFSTQLRETIREELSRARKFRSDHGASHKDGAMDVPFERVNISRDAVIGDDGVPRVRPLEPAGDINRVEELDAHIADLQNMLASTGEDMQISQLELQNMTQRQQQVMNVLSNLSKALHETSMAIIRKIGN